MTGRMKIVLASANAGKQREFSALLTPARFELVLQSELGVTSVEESGVSFAENALLKAHHAARRTGLAALADDSGIEVDALDGRPGVYSARYAGLGASDGDNNALLLRELQAVPDARRIARYRCVLVLMRHPEDASPLVVDGVWEGRIAQAPSGAGGFGYDPLFIPNGKTCTAAELDPAEKNRLSHRALALKALLRQL
jgi:XTP/dITP diphosphohydrolase